MKPMSKRLILLFCIALFVMPGFSLQGPAVETRRVAQHPNTSLRD